MMKQQSKSYNFRNNYTQLYVDKRNNFVENRPEQDSLESTYYVQIICAYLHIKLYPLY